ncbi:MAG: DNA recombination protein RmuC [Robiginitomaculum sp.]|nr:DNA recombination protein RmuC [Robiginitomaculum sp.]MDQ7077969.1 DNA recombination protein RmuC [Robiginitomaculum sp.]
MTNLAASPLLLLIGLSAALAIVLALVVSLLFLRNSRRDDPALQAQLKAMAEQQAALRGALEQMAAGTQSGHGELKRTLDERLDKMGKRLSEGLEQSGEKTGEHLKTLAERLALIDRAQKNIETLSQEVTGLQALLSNKQARGAFGEIQMQDLVKTFLPPSAYGFQETLSNHTRVDCLIRLPAPNDDIAVDSKFPLENWRAMNEAPDADAKKAAARLFTAAVTKHVRDIAEKYLPAENISKPAIMFLPSEAIYIDLHTHFPDIIEKSFRAGVAIVAPTTFMATLHTMRAVMKDAQMREQAHVIQREVEVLLDDISRLDERVKKLDTHFEQSKRDIGQILISTNKIKSRSEKIGDLQLEDDTDSTVLPKIAKN